MSKLYAWREDHVYLFIAKIAANLFNYPVEIVVVPKEDPLNNDKEFKAKKAHGSFPFFESAEGEIVFESSPIAAHIARISGNEAFLGNTAFERAQVTQFVSIAHSGVWPKNYEFFFTVLGHNDDVAKATAGIEAGKVLARQLDAALEGKDWFVGDAFTLADLSLFIALLFPFTLVYDAEFRETIPNLDAWWQKVSKLPVVASSTGYLKVAEKSLFKPVAQ